MIFFDNEKAAKKLIQHDYMLKDLKAVEKYIIKHPEIYEDAIEFIKKQHCWDSGLQAAFDTWLQGGIPEFQYKDMSIKDIGEFYGTNYFFFMHNMAVIMRDENYSIPRYTGKKRTERKKRTIERTLSGSIRRIK